MDFKKEDEYAAICALTQLSDCSSVTRDDDSCRAAEPGEAVTESNTKFPLKLFDILDDEQYADIVRWLPEGNGFFFVDKKKFERELMPLFFKKHTKFTSFTRRLIRWGFVRIPKGSFIGSYFHFLFHKGKRSLCVELCNRLRNKPDEFHQAKSLGNNITKDETNITESKTVNSLPLPPILVPDDKAAITTRTLDEKRALFSAYYSHRVHQEQLRMTRKLLVMRLIEQKQRLLIQNHYYIASMKANSSMQGSSTQVPVNIVPSNNMGVVHTIPKKMIFGGFNAFAA